MGNLRSLLWHHFTMMNNEKARCNHCNFVLSFKGGSTSNLKKHITAKHVSLAWKFKRVLNNKIDLKSANKSSKTQSSTINDTNNSCDSITSDDQPLKNVLQKKIKTGDVSKHNDRHEILLNMFIKDLQPFSLIEDRGFIEFTKSLDPFYEIPSKFELSQQMLSARYDSIVDKVKQGLKSAEYITLSTETWTSPTSGSYFGVSAHFISNDWIFEHAFLDCVEFSQNPTDQHLKTEILNIINSWGIQNKIVAVVTDNTEQIKSAVCVKGWDHAVCFAHKLNSAVQDAVKITIICSLHKKAKDIVEYFHENSVVSEQLKALQQNSYVPINLRNDISTRWISTYQMFLNMIEIKDSLSTAINILQNPVTPFDADEWQILKEITDVLRPIVQVTNELYTDKNVAVSKVILIVNGLERAILSIKKTLTFHYSIDLANILLINLKEQFDRIQYNNIYAAATFLDPRFKHKGLEADAKDICNERLVAKLNEMVEDSENDMDQSQSTTATISNDEIWADFDNSVAADKTTSSSNFTKIEMRQYLEDHLIDRKMDPLLWWKNRQQIYPRLSRLAKQSLCIVATSIPSERVFKEAGPLFSKRRSNLEPEHVKKILFLNGNQ